MTNFIPLNSATFRSVFGDQILAHLANNGKFLENGNIHAASIRSAAVSVRYHAGGRTYTILELLCGKNGVDILGVDGKSADGIVGFAVQTVEDYVREVYPEWFKIVEKTVRSTKQNVSQSVLADLGL